MNYLKKFTLRSLKLNKKRTIVTITGIVLSVALIIAASSLVFSIKETMINYEKTSVGNFHYYFGNVPKSEISYFKENRNFESVFITKELGFAEDRNIKTEYKPYLYIDTYDEQALSNLDIQLISGRLPKNDSEILIPEHLNKNADTNYKIGDILNLEVGTRNKFGEDLFYDDLYNREEPEEIVNTTYHQYKIVGIMKRLNESFNFPGYKLVTKLDNLNASGNYNIYTRYTKKALEDACNITAEILDVDSYALYKTYYEETRYGLSDEELEEYENLREKVENSKYTFSIHNYLISFETNIYKEDIMKFILYAAIVSIAIIIFTSVFCIKNSFSISITEKIKQYGHLNTIGATSKQIKDTVYYEAFILGLIGIPLGIIVGFILSFIILLIANIILAESLGTSFVFGFSFISILLAIVLGSITLFLSSWSSAHKSSKITPIVAINNSEDVKIRRSTLKTPKYIKKIFGIGGEIAYKNLKRNSKKYRTTAFAIVICITIFIGVSTFIDISFKKADEEFKTKDYDIELHSYEHLDKDDKYYDVVNFAGVEDYAIVDETVIQNDSCEESNLTEEYINHYKFRTDKPTYIDSFGNVRNTCNGVMYGISIRVYRLGSHAYNKYLKQLGLKEDEMKNKAILIDTIKDWEYNEKTKKLENITIKKVDFKKGNLFKGYFYTDEWDENGNELTDERGYGLRDNVEIEIGHTTNQLPFSINYDISFLLMIVSDEYYESLFASYNKNYYNHEKIYLKTKNATKLEDEIVEYLKDKKERSYDLNNIAAEEKAIKNIYAIISILLYGFIVIVALISITNIFNTITSNMQSRSREFASLKSIGMTHQEFNKMIRLESIFYGTKSLVIGIILGCLLSRLIDFIMSLEDATIAYKFPLIPIIISIITVFIIIICIMKYSVSKINKQNIIETIRNENI